MPQAVCRWASDECSKIQCPLDIVRVAQVVKPLPTQGAEILKLHCAVKHATLDVVNRVYFHLVMGHRHRFRSTTIFKTFMKEWRNYVVSIVVYD